jgi:hypothetical protein
VIGRLLPPERSAKPDRCVRRVEARLSPAWWRSHGAAAQRGLARPSPATCCAGCGCCASTGRWPRPNRRPCAIDCCTSRPASCAANANEKSASAKPGPGQANSPPASSRRSLCPHQLDVDQRNPTADRRNNPGPVEPRRTRRDSRASSLNRTLATKSTSITKINT